MSARRLGRLVGLVFVLTALFGGGVAAADVAAKHAGVASTSHSALQKQTLDVVWE
jgi:hypothetical protein